MDRDRAARLAIRVSLADQRLDLLGSGAVLRSYSVSTSKFGPGERRDSHKTPRGRHLIRAKIGRDAPLGAVFRGRRPTGEVYSPELAAGEAFSAEIVP